MWDNRCLTHLAVGDYDPAEARHMIRTSGKGDHVGKAVEPEAPALRSVPKSAESGRWRCGITGLKATNS